MYFTYGEKELDFLRQKDKRLAKVIDRIGPVHRTVDTDLFSAVVHHIIGQQISTIECKSNDFRKPYDSYLYSHRTPSETWKENRVITEVC